jgi:hypothetical protein
LSFLIHFSISVFWWSSWVHWHSVLILIDMWWFLPFSCFYCLRIWLCAAKSRLLWLLVFLLLWCNTPCPLLV